jgi:Zn-finger nucleic acid-binding protein
MTATTEPTLHRTAGGQLVRVDSRTGLISLRELIARRQNHPERLVEVTCNLLRDADGREGIAARGRDGAKQGVAEAGEHRTMWWQTNAHAVKFYGELASDLETATPSCSFLQSQMQCPTCDLPLEPESTSGFARCGQCGGQYASHEALRTLLSAHAPPPGARGAGYRRPSPFLDPVRYRKCPVCGEMMLRRNFRESSGVVVDVCSAHGLWLDAGELATILEFAKTGALAKAEHDIVERAAARKRLDAWGEDLRAAGPRHYIGGVSGGLGGPIDALADIAHVIPGIDPDDD